MTTLLDLIERVRGAAGDRPSRDTFAATLAADGSTAVTFSDGSRMPAGGIIDTPKFETMRIVSKTTGDVTTGVVERAIFGTTQAAFSSGDDVYIGQRYTYAQYRRAINNALAALSIEFGNPSWDATQTFGPTTLIYPVPAAATRVFNVQYVPNNLTALRDLPFEYVPSAPTAVVSTGKAVVLKSRMNPGNGTVYIGYEKPWTALSATTDALDSTYPAEGEDAIVTGAMSYLQDEEAFRRVAFDSPHAKQQVFATSETEANAASVENLSRFLQRRAELAVRYRRVNTTWMKG